MKSVGIVRKIDMLGRVVIPKETRDMLAIEIKDPLEIYTEENEIRLKKYNPGCTFCGSLDDLENIKGINVCNTCKSELIKKYEQSKKR